MIHIIFNFITKFTVKFYKGVLELYFTFEVLPHDSNKMTKETGDAIPGPSLSLPQQHLSEQMKTIDVGKEVTWGRGEKVR